MYTQLHRVKAASLHFIYISSTSTTYSSIPLRLFSAAIVYTCHGRIDDLVMPAISSPSFSVFGTRSQSSPHLESSDSDLFVSVVQ